VRFAAVVLALTACTGPDLATQESELSAAVRAERFALIRDAAAEMGLYNAPLLAGVALSETNLAHCASEASFGCPGPASPSCGGGAIIAGGADGPCADMQGGLGMFQFDAGTYAQTLATYGDSVLTIEGNTAQAVNFVVVRAIMDISQATDWLTAVAWMNEIPMQTSAAKMVEWADFIVCRYNGCCSTSSTCTTRRAGYRDNAIDAFAEMGAAFWTTSNRCGTLPADGIIDQRSGCYIAGGDPRYWRRVDAGYGETSEWTGTTAAAAAANFGRWIIKAGRATRYHVDVYLDGGTTGTSTTAKYTVVHGGVTETVMVDQTSATGFVTIGEFDFAGTGDEYIELGDNTGEAGSLDRQLMFDAVRVLPLDGGPVDDGDGGGCCQSSRGSRGNMLLFVLAAFVLRSRSSSRRVRRRARA
jgi:hypothetical protein